ncbi:MAG TPA: hypothetical protein VKR55_12940 [Bradyrhizobium sp.]|uniref:hypothetical protein n=1 Tax=Bradyrhizobium sp. TaxID=376 RepID=UPI002C7D0509|nr:hypothetical protein [Bradyrhizobium sp.]HLZ03045.1 hypothetical protein [Bradyrhizobium sp.]
MNRLWTASAAAALLMVGAVAPAVAAPPTVVPSPGYDARLQESRKAIAATPSVVDPAPTAWAARRRHVKRKH